MLVPSLASCSGGGAHRSGTRTLAAVAENQLAASSAPMSDRPLAAARRLILPLALAQFICSFAGSNMNVMINDISRGPGHDRQGRPDGDHALPADHGDPDDSRQQANRPLGPKALLPVGPHALRDRGVDQCGLAGSRRA